MNVKRLTQTALMMALVFVVTRFIQIPIPLGYLNIGNSVILLSCLIIPAPYGIIASACGSALADLLSFPAYTIPTLIIKSLMPIVYYLIVKTNPQRSATKIVAVIVSTIIPLVGYTVTGMILYGGFAAGLAQLPGLLIEYVLNAIIFIVLMKPISKIIKWTD